MKVYLDEDFRCHVAQNAQSSLREGEISTLDGKCRTYVEGMRYVPQGETWTREDGEIFAGEMLAPHQPFVGLLLSQGAYEDALATLRADLQPQLDDVLVALVEV